MRQKKLIKIRATVVSGPMQAQIVVFTEQPSDARSHDRNGSPQNLQAADLFSLFTADIIKEGKIFTR